MRMRNSPRSSLGFSLIIKYYDRITQQLSVDRKIIPIEPVVVELWVSDVGLPFFIRSDCVFKKMLDCISSKGRIAFKHMARLNIIVSHIKDVLLALSRVLRIQKKALGHPKVLNHSLGREKATERPVVAHHGRCFSRTRSDERLTSRETFYSLGYAFHISFSAFRTPIFISYPPF